MFYCSLGLFFLLLILVQSYCFNNVFLLSKFGPKIWSKKLINLKGFVLKILNEQKISAGSECITSLWQWSSKVWRLPNGQVSVVIMTKSNLDMHQINNAKLRKIHEYYALSKWIVFPLCVGVFILLCSFFSSKSIKFM